MTAPRIPANWMHLRPGEMVHSKMPHHKLTVIAKIMAIRGVSVKLNPSHTGYFVACTKRKKDAA